MPDTNSQFDSSILFGDGKYNPNQVAAFDPNSPYNWASPNLQGSTPPTYDNPDPYGGRGNMGQNTATSASSQMNAGPSKKNYAGMAGGSLVNAALGGIETIWSMHKLNQLEKTPFPQYSISPELQSAYSEALGLKDQGLTAAEKSSFQADINRGAETNYQKAIRASGGSMSNAIMGAVNAEQLGAYDKLAATDAELHRQNLQSYFQISGEMQRQRNLISQQQIEQRMQLEQQYGKTLNAGVSNITNAASSLAMLAPLLL
jgi:hypothetical protein